MRSGCEAKGVPVRIGSRSGEPPFDWEKPETWAPTLEEILSAYISYYPDLAVPGAADLVGSFANLAVKEGVPRLVLLSGRGEQEAEHAGRRLATRAPTSTMVHTSWFMQNFSEDYIVDYILAGEMPLPAGDTPEPFVDADDIANIAVASLTDDKHIGELYKFTGPRLLTFADTADEIGKAAGQRHPVRAGFDRTVPRPPLTSNTFRPRSSSCSPTCSPRSWTDATPI